MKLWTPYVLLACMHVNDIMKSNRYIPQCAAYSSRSYVFKMLLGLHIEAVLLIIIASLYIWTIGNQYSTKLWVLFIGDYESFKEACPLSL